MLGVKNISYSGSVLPFLHLGFRTDAIATNIFPSLEMNFESAHKHPEGDEGYWGRVWTAMNTVNTIPTVLSARPGVLTHLDMPFVRPPGLVRPRTEGFGEPTGV